MRRLKVNLKLELQHIRVRECKIFLLGEHYFYNYQVIFSHDTGFYSVTEVMESVSNTLFIGTTPKFEHFRA